MKRVKLICYIGFFLHFQILFSQRLNQVLLSGNDIGFTQQIDFRTSPPSIKEFKSPIPFDDNVFYITDDKDSLWMFGNGCSFSDKNGNIIFNKDSFDLGYDSDSFCGGGLVRNQGMIMLPSDNSQWLSIYKPLNFVIHPTFVELYCPKEYLSIITKDFYKKDIVISNDTFTSSNITACKAKQADWWVVDLKFKKNEFVKYLIGNEGVKYKEYQSIGLVPNKQGNGVGSALFSPDGNQYAFTNAYDGVFLFDFDRETGLLSNPRNVLKNEGPDQAAQILGLAFSANSRYLYACCNRYLYQVDTKQTELVDGLVMIDSVVIGEKSACSTFPLNFYKPWLAPDCRIYVIPGSSDWCIHVIQNPDFPGKLCNFEKSVIKVPFYYYHSLPTYINEMLDIGPPCDSTLPLPVATADLSFSQIGELIVSPNPTSGTMRILGIDADTYISEINIMNMNGTREIQLKPNDRLTSSGLSVDASILNNGVYVLQAITKAGAFYIGKFVVMKQ